MAPKPRSTRHKKSININRQRVKKRTVKKRKTAGAGVCSRGRPRRHCLSRGSSVQLVAILPCCSDEKQLRKYSRLKLNSALFCSKRRPARRKQSHISVITISSSDEETGNTRVVEWLESMELDRQAGTLCDEEAFIGDMDPSGSDSRTAQVCEAEEIRHQMSLLRLPSSSTQRTGHLNVNMPVRRTEPPSDTLNSTSHIENHTLLDPQDHNPLPSTSSYFTNPPGNVMTRKGAHTVWSGMPSGALNLEECSTTNTQKFFFGPERKQNTSTSVLLNSEINNFPSTSKEYSSSKEL